MENEIALKMMNVQSELLFVGALYSSPDLYITYGSSIRSKYDFEDKATRFFYDVFEDYYLTFSQEITENKLNTFCSQNIETFKKYRAFKGWSTVKSMMEMADVNDIKNYFNTVKKYSLIREYNNNGFPAEKILQFKDFQRLSANDIYRIMRSKCDKINTDVSVMDEPVVLTNNTVSTIDSYLATPEMGIPLSWEGYNEYFRGLLPSTVIFQGLLSNEGKSRMITMMAADVVLRQKCRVMIISNEMTERAIKNCLITTVINNPIFKELHGIDINKNEKELTLGLYKDESGEFVVRKTDDSGEFIESEEEYIERVKATEEYQKVKAVGEWLERQTEGKLYFHDITSDYSQEAIELEIRKSKVVYKCDVFIMDTMKVDKLESWDRLKMLATKIVELGKELKMSGIATFQLTDATVFDDIFDLSSNNIGAAKGIKHPVDVMLLGKKLKREEYDKYQYMPFATEESLMWGDPVSKDLNPKKEYIAFKIDKNRLASKTILLFQYDLNYNVWLNVGELQKKF